MIKRNRYNIVVVDKKNQFPFLFQGFRKHKYAVTRLATINELTSNELSNFNLVFVVMYEFKDVFELLVLNSTNSSIIVGSSNTRILKNLKSVNSFQVINLSGNLFNINSNFHDCINKFLG